MLCGTHPHSDEVAFETGSPAHQERTKTSKIKKKSTALHSVLTDLHYATTTNTVATGPPCKLTPGLAVMPPPP